MEIITEAGPGSGEGGFYPFIEWAACFSKPVNYISQHSLCLPSFQSLWVVTGPVVLPLIVILLPQIALFFSHPASKTENKTQAVITGQNEALCYVTVVHSAANETRHWRWRRRKQSELLFFFSSLLLPQMTEGAGINHADNCVPHNERCRLENRAVF